MQFVLKSEHTYMVKIAVILAAMLILLFSSAPAHGDVEDVVKESIKKEEISFLPYDLYQKWSEVRKKKAELEKRLAIEGGDVERTVNGIAENKNILKNLTVALGGLRGAERKEQKKKIEEVKYKITELNAALRERENKTAETRKLLPLVEKEYQESAKNLRVGLLVYSKGFIWIFFLFVFIFLSSFLIRRYIGRIVEDPAKIYKIRRTTKVVTWVFLFLAVTVLILENVKGAFTLLGLIGAGVAIALQDFFKSLMGWAVLVVGKGVKVGDRIQVGDLIGDVIEIGFIRTRLMEAGAWMQGEAVTGRGILLTNNFVFTKPVLNYHYGFGYVWKQMELVATFESDWRSIRDSLKTLLEDGTKEVFAAANIEIRRMCLQQNLPMKSHEPRVYMTISDYGYKFTLRFLATPHGILGVKSDLSTKIAELFESNAKFEFAYPTQRMIPTPDEHYPLITSDKV